MGKPSVINKILLALMVLGLLTNLGCQKEQSAAAKPFPKEALQAQLTIVNAPSVLKRNEATKIQVRVKNIGNAAWPAKGQPDGKYRLNLSYHWLDLQKNIVIAEGMRTLLPYDIEPNAELMVNADVVAPNQVGEYILEIDMVQEAVTWFNNPAQTRVVVD